MILISQGTLKFRIDGDLKCSTPNCDRNCHRSFEITTAIATATATVPFPMPRAVFGGALAARWGLFGMNRPVHPTVMGDAPGSASGAETVDATGRLLCAPQRGMPCDCIGAESTDARALGWAGPPTKSTRSKMRISRTTSKGSHIDGNEKLKLPAEACAPAHAFRAMLFYRYFLTKLRRLLAPL